MNDIDCKRDTILIRADANEIIGTGHVMRCLSIAKSFAEKEKNVTFVTADHRGDGLITQQGFGVVCLNSDWTDMKSERLYKVVERYKPALLLVDSYYVTKDYFNNLCNYSRIAYIDDLNHNQWDIDYLINYNIFSLTFNYSAYEQTKTKLLLGPKYAPLRDEFRNCSKHTNGSVSDILISAGGADPERVTEKMISGICAGMPDIQFHFVVGALNPRMEEIRGLAYERKNVVLHINEKHMSDLMKNCDIAISAAGTTLYELCATGIPTITYTLADNQLVAAKQFDQQGIMLNAGDCRGDDSFTGKLEHLVKRLAEDGKLRKEMSERMQNLVDGNGACRIADELCNHAVEAERFHNRCGRKQENDFI